MSKSQNMTEKIRRIYLYRFVLVIEIYYIDILNIADGKEKNYRKNGFDELE